ncbi:MAG TPA: hypothetical protein V6D08_10450 [Candidatus Obscuribacterales bacterium]
MVLLQTGAPALAQGLGQSGWITPGQTGDAQANGLKTLGQSSWVTPGSAAAGQGMDQHAAITASTGQSAWMSTSGMPAGIHGRAASSTAAPQSAFGQQISPQAPVAAPVLPPAKPVAKQPDWVASNRALAAQARQKHAERMNQSRLAVPGAFGETEIVSSATMTPTRLAREPAGELTGGISQVDIVGDSAAFGAAGANPYSDSSLSNPTAGGGFAVPVQGQLPAANDSAFGEAVGEAVGEPVGEPVDGAVPSMQEMIANVMAVPMMMAASAGLLGQGFGRYAPGAGVGFRTYGPGGIGPGTMGIGIAGYSVGRVANRLANHLTRQAIKGMYR